MDIQIQETGNATVVSVAGKLNAMTAPTLESSIATRIEEGSTCIALDLGGIDYISSAGLRVILATAKSLKNKAGKLLLANVSEPVKEVFDISGFGSIFTLYESVDAALATVG